MVIGKYFLYLLSGFSVLTFTGISRASDLDQQHEALLKANEAIRKNLEENEADIKKVEKAKAAEEANAKESSADDIQKQIDQGQNDRITKLESGILDDENLTGDILKFRTHVFPFSSLNSSSKYCAPATSKAKVKEDKDGTVHVYFKRVSGSNLGSCSYDFVEKGVQYKIDKSELNQFTYKRTGVVYGGLVVPFKYYTGGDKRISASSTIAPFIGIRGLAHAVGLHVTPIVSAGLGFVPVNKEVEGDDGMVKTSTDTKPALSVATGLVFTPEKNKSITAGILIGKDFLSNEDRISDPTLDKPWVSLYIGLKVGGSE